MYNGYNIVVNTAAGRRRYMQYLVPMILSTEIVDRYDIWVNTYNGADIAFFKQLAEHFPKVNLVWQPDGVVNGIKSINAFYKDCIDEDTIYFKIDDDLLWIEPKGIEKMVKFRVDNPDYFLVSPIVINNSLSTYLLQVRNKIVLDKYYNSSANNPILWESPFFANQLHTWFIDNYLSKSKWDQLHIGSQPMAMTRFSINSVLWFGKDLKLINGIVPGDDEEFLSSIFPTKIGKANCWNGDVISAHFAFYPQRAYLDSQHILNKYGEVINNLNKGSHYEKAFKIVAKILKNVNSHAEELEPICDPYIHQSVTTKKSTKSNLLFKYPYLLISKIKHNMKVKKEKKNKCFIQNYEK